MNLNFQFIYKQQHRNDDPDNSKHLEIITLLRSQFERHQGNAKYTHCYFRTKY